MMQSARFKGAIIAGGASSRMQADGLTGDKYLLPFGKARLIDYVVARFRPQVRELFINANGDPQRLADLGLPLCPDLAMPVGGPLVGIASALNHAGADDYLATIAADTPFFPINLVDALTGKARQTGAPLILAASNGRLHPVFGLWHHSLAEKLQTWLHEPGKASIMRFADHVGFATVEFTDFAVPALEMAVDPFFNINEPRDLHQAQLILEANP